MGGNVALTEAPSSLSNEAMLRMIGYASLMARTCIICVFAGTRIDAVFQEEKNQSAFEHNKVFAIIGLVAFTLVAFVSVTSLLGHDRPMKHNCSYTFLKFTGSFSAFLAPFSILMVALLPPRLNWIGYFVACLVFGIFVTCLYLDDHDQRQDRVTCLFNEYALVLLLILSFWTFMWFAIPNRILFPLVCVSVSMEIAFHLITYLMFIYQKTRTPPNDLEAHKLIQPDENKYCYTYLMPLTLGSSSS